MTARNLLGWKGNVLGLARYEVEIAHDAAHTIRLDLIEPAMLSGVDFWAAKANAIKAQPWKHHDPLVAEAVKRIVEGFDFSDISRSTWRAVNRRYFDEITKERKPTLADKISFWFYDLLYRFG